MSSPSSFMLRKASISCKNLFDALKTNHPKNKKNKSLSIFTYTCAKVRHKKKNLDIYILCETLPFVAREETESPGRRKHDESNINITKNWKFVGFFDKPISSLWESDLPVCSVLNSFYLKLYSSHLQAIYLFPLIA